MQSFDVLFDALICCYDVVCYLVKVFTFLIWSVIVNNNNNSNNNKSAKGGSLSRIVCS